MGANDELSSGTELPLLDPSEKRLFTRTASDLLSTRQLVRVLPCQYNEEETSDGSLAGYHTMLRTGCRMAGCNWLRLLLSLYAYIAIAQAQSTIPLGPSGPTPLGQPQSGNATAFGGPNVRTSRHCCD
jgi:hypothetical protein